VNGFFKRNRDCGLERELRRHRPEPQDSFVRSLSDRIQEGARPVRSRPLRGRLALLGAATAVMLAGLGAFGGMSYAASAARTVAVEMKAVVTPVADPNKSGGGRDNGSGDNHDGGDHGGGGGGGDHSGGGGDHGKPDDDQYGHKVPVCHNPGPHQVTLEVSWRAVPALLAHGDYLGPCRRWWHR
jgi:hypothetical protein